MAKVILITGASSGIGKACAEYLGQRSYCVYGTSRQAPSGVTASGSFQMIQMDVTDDESVARGVGLIVEREGRLDVAVNNAGISLVGPIEDATIEQVKLQFETNFFGVMRVCKAALPVMREQHSGHIINISSMAGRVGAPYQGLYSAAKFAVEGLSEALRAEVRHFGIKVALIEPGDSPTDLTFNRIRIFKTPAYAPYYNNAMQVYEHDERNGYPPAKFGPLLEQIIENPHPRMRYMRGLIFQTVGATLKNFVPYSLFEWGLAQVYKF
jgi:NAD(P)-dependent dehydrogenase (short-subunit alcohol dehydrogenase family)